MKALPKQINRRRSGVEAQLMRLLRWHSLSVFLSLPLIVFPVFRCDFSTLFVANFGLFWILYGGLHLVFGWPMAMRGGGAPCSPRHRRGVWLLFVHGMIVLGSLCLASSLGFIPQQIASC